MTPLGYHARQRGLGLIGFLGAIALVMVAATLLVKIVPIYLEHWTVRSVLDGLAEAPPPVEDAEDLRRIVQRRLAINDVRRIGVEQIEVRADEAGGWRIRIHYQAEAPLSGNLSLVARFDDQVHLPGIPVP